MWEIKDSNRNQNRQRKGKRSSHNQAEKRKGGERKPNNTSQKTEPARTKGRWTEKNEKDETTPTTAKLMLSWTIKLRNNKKRREKEKLEESEEANKRLNCNLPRFSSSFFLCCNSH